MIPNCERHRFDQAEDECRECKLSYCDNCLVYVNGAESRPLCIQCALKRSGVRGSNRTRPSRRHRRARAKAEKAVANAQANQERADEAVPVAAANEVELENHEPGWVSLDASRWDIGAI